MRSAERRISERKGFSRLTGLEPLAECINGGFSWHHLAGVLSPFGKRGLSPGKMHSARGGHKVGRYVRIVKWEKFQHYKDRNPPWIKLHRELLMSETWVSLDDASRVLAIACMLLAAQTGNRIPADPKYLRRVAYLNSTPDLTKLISVHFIEYMEDTDDASKVEQMLTNVRPETETETEKKKLSKRLADDFAPNDRNISLAAELGLDVTEQLTAFGDFHQSKGSTFVNWHLAFNTWLRRASSFSDRKAVADVRRIREANVGVFRP